MEIANHHRMNNFLLNFFLDLMVQYHAKVNDIRKMYIHEHIHEKCGSILYRIVN